MADKEKWPEYLKSFPCLWNTQDADFSNEIVKEACRERLLEICNLQSSLPIDMESLKQWLNAYVVTPDFQPDLEDLALEYPCLWNPKDPNYKNYSMRERCKRQLLAKCNSLSPTVITMCTLRRKLSSICSRMRRKKKPSRTPKKKHSPVPPVPASQDVQSVPVSAPAPPASSELPRQIISPPGRGVPQQIISPPGKELTQQIISPLKSELPQQIISPPGSGLPQQMISPLKSELPQQIISPPGSGLPQQMISPLKSELPQQIISPPGSGLPQQMISPLKSELPQQIISPPEKELTQQMISPLKSELPQQIISPLKSELPQHIISPPGTDVPQQIISPLKSEVPQQIISPPGTELQQIIIPPGKKLPQQIIRPPGTQLPQQIISPLKSELPQQIISPSETELQQTISPLESALPQQMVSPPGSELPQQIISPSGTELQQIISPPGTELQQTISPLESALHQLIMGLPESEVPQLIIRPPANGLPLQIIRVTSGTVQCIPSANKENLPITSHDTSADIGALPQVTTTTEIPPVVPITAEPENDQNLLKEAEKYKAKRRKSIEKKTPQLQKMATEITPVVPINAEPQNDHVLKEADKNKAKRRIRRRSSDKKTPQLQNTATEIPPDVPLIADPENDQNSPKDAEKNKAKRRKSSEKKTPTLSALAEEFPCLWDPDHPHYGFGAVRNLSLQLLLVKYNDIYPEKLTLHELRKKVKNRARTIFNNKTRNKAPTDKQINIQDTAEESSSPPSDDCTLLEISSDSDEPLNNYKHEEPQNQETTDITDPTTDIIVPNTEITVPNTEITVPNTEITVPHTETTATDMEIKMSITDITPATETPLLGAETAVPENDQNSHVEIETNKTKCQISLSAPKKSEKGTQQPTVATLMEEFPCLWDPEHPDYESGAVTTRSLQLLLEKYNNVFPNNITMWQLKKKIWNFATKKSTGKSVNFVTQNCKAVKPGVSRLLHCEAERRPRHQQALKYVKPTLATLFEEFPCLWDPEHPHYEFGAVTTLSLQLLLAKYNNVFPKKITMSQLKKKIRNFATKKPAGKAMNFGTQNWKKPDCPKNQESNIQNKTEESSQPPPDKLALFEISSDSSDSDVPLSNYKHQQPQNQEITAPNTAVTVPNTVITFPNTEITVPNTEITVHNTEVPVPNTEINVRNTGITVPNTGIISYNTGMTVPNTKITVPNKGIAVPNTGIISYNTGMTEPNTKITVPNTGVTFSKTGIIVPNTGITVPNTGISVPNTGIIVPNTAITVPNTGTTVPNTGITMTTTGIIVPNRETTVPDTGITVPNAVISFNWCRFCGELKNNCTNAFFNNKPYLTRRRTECSVFINDIWFKVGFHHKTFPKTICGDCDTKLKEIYAFVNHVKETQATFKTLEQQRLKRKSESVDDTEFKDGSGGKKFRITIDFNSDTLPSLSGDEDDCVEINCNDKTDLLTETDEVVKENCEVIDLSDDDIVMEPKVEERPLLTNDIELRNEVSESSKGVSVDISSQSQCVYETSANVINSKVEANSLSVTDADLDNEVVKEDSKCVVPVNILFQSPCVNGKRWVEVGPITVNDRDVNNEESERIEIGDSDSSQSCVDENNDDSLSATDTVVNEVDRPNKSKVPVDISSNDIVYSYKVNGKDFIGLCTDKGSRSAIDTLANKASVQTDLNSHSALEDDANGAVSKYRHLLLDSLSLDTGKNYCLVSVNGKSHISPCDDDDLNILNNDVVTKYKLLLDSHSSNTKSREISEQNDTRVVSVDVKSHLTPSNNDDNINNDIESKYRHLLLDSLAVSTESAKVSDEKNNDVVSVDVKPRLSPSNNDDDGNNDGQSKYRPSLKDESTKATEQKNNCVISADVTTHLSPSCNTDNGNNDVQSKYKHLLLDSLSVDAESATVNERKSQNEVSAEISPSNKDDDKNNGVGSHENETDSNDTDSYEKFIKEVLLQAINSAGISIRNSGESIKGVKCVGNGTIVDVKKEIDDDITDKDV